MNFKKNASFTLLETLISSLIGVIVLSGIVSYITVSSRINEAVVLQSKGQNILNFSSRILEKWIKNGSLLEVKNDGDILIVYDSYSMEIVRFTISSANLKIQVFSETEKNLVIFEDVSFNGSFALGTEARAVYIDLKITFIGGKSTISSRTTRFIAKCRNHIYS